MVIRLLLALLIASPCAAQSIDTLALRAHTRFLSSDLLEGRGTGTRGEHLAGLYIATQLARMGISPIAGDDYLLAVPLKRATIDPNATTVTFDGATYRHDNDFIWAMVGRGGMRDFSGDLMYVGAVDSAALARVSETRGRVVVLRGGAGSLTSRFIPALIRAGAAGLIVMVPDSMAFAMNVRSRGPARFFVDAKVDDPIFQPDIPYILAGPSLTRAIVTKNVTTPFTRIAGPFAAHFKASIDAVRALNVVGVIRGSDPKLADEYVAYTAHYDHLGISVPEAGDSIYNGFSDNAAGVAMLLALGDVLRREPPLRSVLLLFFTGEERGLLGSTFFAAHPPLPLSRIRGLINLDAGAPPAPPIEWRIAAGSLTPLGAVAQTALETRGWTARLDAGSPNSDHWPFLQRGVPSVFIIPGRRWENVTEEEQRALISRWDRYHRAGDEWHEDFPFSGLARYAEAALLVGRAVAGRK